MTCDPPHQLIVQCRAPSTPGELIPRLRAMNTLAKKLATKYNGEYDGHGVGFGKIDEYIYFGRKDHLEAAARGIFTLMDNPNLPKSITYWKKDLREKMCRAKEGQVRRK